MKTKKSYAYNVVLQSPFTGDYWFCPKVELLGGGMNRVIGKKYCVTDSMQALFGPMLKRERKRVETAAKKKGAKR